MNPGTAILPLLLVLACGCSDEGDTDPDGQPTDAVDDSVDAVLDADAADPIPDGEDDCHTAAPFEASCPGTVSCPDRGDLPSTCNLDLIQFTSTSIEGDFVFDDHGVTDACASLCECPGFIKMQVDSGGEHVVGSGIFSTPSVSFDMGGSTNPFTLTTHILESFDPDGQTAGLYVLEDSTHVLSVLLDCSSGATQILTQLHMPSGGEYTHSDAIPGSDTNVTLSIQRTDDTHWNILVNGTTIPIAHTFSLTVHEVGIVTGNHGDSPMTAALFDYICINEP